MPTNQESESSDSPKEDPHFRIIGKYQNHLSTKLIKSKNKTQTLKFRDTNFDEIKKSIENLDPKKASQKSDMNTNIIRKNVMVIRVMISMLLCIHNELKEADIVPVHKKKSKLPKENYRPISILPNISKVYERYLYD